MPRINKKFTFPPKEELERVRKRIARPGYRRVNIGLLPDATQADKFKYHLCKSILALMSKITKFQKKS